MNSLTVSGIRDVDKSILMQLMELVGPIESYIYSEDTTQVQVNYKEKQNTAKVVNIFNNIQINGISLLFSQGTLEENVDKKYISIQQIPIESKENSDQNGMKEIGTKLTEGFSELWSELNEKVPLAMCYETAKIQISEFNKEHQITERMSHFINDIGSKCKSMFVKSIPETKTTTEYSTSSKEINIEDD